MTRLEIDWPDEGAERVRAAEGRLRVAGEALARRPFDERVTAVAGVLEDWTRPDSPWRRELVAALADETPFAAPTIAEGLESALRAWHPADFIACAEREIGGACIDGRRALVPFEWTTVIAGGALPMPTLLQSLLSLVVGSPVLLRETKKDPVTARLLARSMAERDEGLAAAFESIAFPSDDAAALDAALVAPCIVAIGADETLASIADRLRPMQRFVGYGHRFSIGALGPALGEAGMKDAASGLALDVARWDQSGCLSPVFVYLVGWNGEDSKRFATMLDRALEDVAETSPRGDLPMDQSVSIAQERSEARMRSATGDGLLFEGTQHTLVLEPDARPRPAPLGRFLRLLPVDSVDALTRALKPFSGQLSNVCVAGFEAPTGAGGTDGPSPAPSTEGAFDEHPGGSSFFTALSRMGVSRVTKPGGLQTPPIDWPHDGLPLFLPLARFTEPFVAGRRRS